MSYDTPRDTHTHISDYINIDCTDYNDNNIFKQECIMEYLLNDKFNLSKIIQTSDIVNCYWIDVKYLFRLECLGTCGNISFYDYNITMELVLNQILMIIILTIHLLFAKNILVM